jgi:signal recognition particle subunit SEC65
MKLDPKKRLLASMEMIRDKHLGKFDLAMTSWANSDSKIRKVVNEVVKMRLDYLRKIFAELGFKGDELEDTVFPDLSDQQHSKLLKLRYQYLIQK